MRILILNSRCNDLQSVNKISLDIIEAYKENNFFDVCLLDLERDVNTSLNDLRKIAHADAIVVAHPLIYRHPSFPLFLKLMNKKQKIVLHLFGDFVRQMKIFISLEDILKDRNVCFLVPSEGFWNVVSPLFNKAEDLRVIPFPVDGPISLDAKKDETKKIEVVYCGRVSKSKNIKGLIPFLSYLNQEKISFHLNIVGAFDDFEYSVDTSERKLGDTFFELQELLRRKDVTYHGQLNKDQMSHLYQRMDLFISLSRYHDDDFGRAPVEALFKGIPCVLTHWIGYRDLIKNHASSVFGVHGDRFFGFKEWWLSYNSEKQIRMKDLEQSLKRYDILEVGLKYEQNLKNSSFEFRGFTDEARELDPNHINSDLYLKMYGDKHE